MKSIAAAGLLLILAAGKARPLQVPALQEEAPNSPAVATVTFTMSLWKQNPPYYSLAISSMGSATYWAILDSDPRTGAPDVREFPVSATRASQIFRLIRQLNFFSGNLKISQSGAARLGSKSFTFASGPVSNQIVYAATKNRQLKQLTALFQNMAATLEAPEPGRMIPRR